MDAPAIARVRARGRVLLGFARRGDGGTYASDVSESGGYRARFPRSTVAGVPEAVLINTGGGMAAGDSAEFGIAVAPGARAMVTTQAAERIYRSDGLTTRVTTTAHVESGGALAWLPQETIFYNEARLARSLSVDLAVDSTLLAAEVFVFGRLAMGERIRQGDFDDRWRIRRGGRLIFADSIRLDGAVTDALDRAAVGGGARVIGTFVVARPDVGGHLDAARAVLLKHGCGAASTWNDLLVARLVSDDPRRVRAAVAELAAWAWQGPVPRVWWS
jgi:urease accessory protein